MKTNLRSSLLATSVLSMLLVSGVTHAEDKKSSATLPPVKIQKSTVAPSSSVGPFVTAKVPVSPQANATVKEAKDVKPSAQLPSVPVVKPAAAPATVVVKPATAPVTVAKPEVKPQAKTEIKKISEVKKPGVVHIAEKRSSLPVKIVKTSRSSRQKVVIRSKDAAEAALNRCVATSKHVVGCMNRVLERAWVKLDAAETRLMNCGELRKLQNNNEPTIEVFVVSKMYKLRQSGSKDLNMSLAAGGKVSRRMSQEIELRSMMKNTQAVTEFADKVCDASEFQRAFAESAAGK